MPTSCGCHTTGHDPGCPFGLTKTFTTPAPAPTAPRGWTCPRCNAVNGPGVAQCPCSRGSIPGERRLLTEG